MRSRSMRFYEIYPLIYRDVFITSFSVVFDEGYHRMRRYRHDISSLLDIAS